MVKYRKALSFPGSPQHDSAQVNQKPSRFRMFACTVQWTLTRFISGFDVRVEFV